MCFDVEGFKHRCDGRWCVRVQAIIDYLRFQNHLDVERIGTDGSRGAVGCDQGQVIMSDGRYHDMFDPLESLFSFTNCDVTLSALQIENNIVSAINPILEANLSTLSLNEVHFTDNINGQGSTGIILNQSSVSMIDSTLTGLNGGLHRGMLLSDSSLTVWQWPSVEI